MANVLRRCFLELLFFLSSLTSFCFPDGILGCGGFIRSSVDIEYAKVQVKLYTKQGSLKYQTDCAPNNGYYFMPVYDKGDYVIKIEPPDGWSFQPSEVSLTIDGQTDACSKGRDVDFTFEGFGITGQVVSLGSSEGPAGVTVTLKREKGGEELHPTTTTGPGGRFTFSPVPAGDYEVTASHAVWKLARQRARVSVRGDNGNVGTQLAVAGFDISGKVVSGAEPVSGVTFVLHGRRPDSAPLQGCQPAPPPGYSPRPGLEPALCRVSSTDDGAFLFPVVPSGSYVVVPFYAGAKTRFDVRPAEVSVTVAQDSAAIAEPFQVAGFTIAGRVLTSAGSGAKAGLSGATVYLDGKQVAVTAADGSYTVESANSGQYRLTVEAEAMQFEPRTVSVSPSSPQLPDVVAATFQVCGKVDLSDLPDGVQPGPRSVEFKLAGSETAFTVVTDADGKFCIFLRPASYRLRVVVSEDERKRGLSFGSALQDLAVSAPVRGVHLSPFRARVSGAVRCLQPCPGLQLSLSAEGLPARQAVTAADGAFRFEDVLPGQYDVTAVKPEWCWESASVPVTVAASDVSDVRLTQTGYRLTVSASHATTLLYRPASAEPAAARTAELGRGETQLCVPEPGAYLLEPRGCHQFGELPVRADTAGTAGPVQLRAVAHTVSGAVTCERPCRDVRVRLAVDADSRALETTAEDGGRRHRFAVSARPGEVLTFQPQSDTLLFSPTYRQLTAGDDCLPDAVQFTARQGTFITGKIKPALAGAKVTVSASDMEPVTAVTDDNGAYQIGPLHPERQYDVTAEKEGYVISGAGEKGHFQARKLAELRVRVTDTDGRPLPGVLVSVSGGKDYRKNSLTDADGRQVFLSLSPGQYFIRPMMKEYEFTPASKMAEISEGATLEVTVSGRRVAYSLLGRVTSLTGEPEAGVVVEAVAGEACQRHQEEAASEPGGTLRIRGLRPQCEYTVRMKPDLDSNSPFSRGIPDSQTVKVTDGDISDFRLVAFRRVGETDVTVHVVAAPEHLSSLRLVVSAAASESPLYSQPLAGAPFVVLPSPLARDGREYVARLESSLSAATHLVRPAEVTFAADAAARHLRLEFSAERRHAEAELGAGPVLGLPLTLLALALALNQRRCLELLRRLRERYAARQAGGHSRRESAAAGGGDGGGVMVRPVTVKVKARKV